MHPIWVYHIADFSGTGENVTALLEWTAVI